MKNLILLLTILPLFGYGQSNSGNTATIIVNQANKQMAGIEYGKLTLLGNVALQIGDTKITCDSAIVDNKNYAVSAYGNVIMSTSSELQFHSSYVNVDFPNAGIVRMVYYEGRSPQFINTPDPFKQQN